MTEYAPNTPLVHMWKTELEHPEDLLICDDVKRIVASYWDSFADRNAVRLSEPSIAVECGLLVSRCEVLG